MKIGIDFHGVIDQFPKIWIPIMTSLIKDGHEVHILTGARQETFQKEMKKIGWDIPHTHFFSVSDFIQNHYPDQIDLTDPDRPLVADKTLWDSIKGHYAKDKQLDAIIDDTPHYRHYLSDIPFILMINHKNNNCIKEEDYISTFRERKQ